MTEIEWHAMMDVVVPECRRVLKPAGSAVFVLQPNSETPGRMRLWLWEFMVKWGRAWGIVQDAWWWNVTAIPEHHAIQAKLLRPSLKACVWLGSLDCRRDQDAVLWGESEANAEMRASRRASNEVRPSRHHSNSRTLCAAAEKRGGVTPYNVLPFPNSDSSDSGGAHGHGAATPAALCEWWVRYLCPPGGTVLDPFLGSGTVGIAAIRLGRKVIGIERDAGYAKLSEMRILNAMEKRGGVYRASFDEGNAKAKTVRRGFFPPMLLGGDGVGV